MAPINTIVLSSSPSRSIIHSIPPSLSPAISSPGLPSPSVLIRKEQAISLSESRLLFCQAHTKEKAMLLSYGRGKETQERGESQSDKGKAKRQRDQVVFDPGPVIPLESPDLPPRNTTKIKKSLAPEGPSEVLEDGRIAATTKNKRSRAKKANKGIQTTIKKGNVTKLNVGETRADGLNVSVKAKRVQSLDAFNTGGAERKWGTELSDVQVLSVTEAKDGAGLSLNRVNERRRDWTPIDDTRLAISGKDLDLQEQFDDNITPLSTDIKGLLKDYNYDRPSVLRAQAVPARSSEGEAFIKRRKLEVINVKTRPTFSTNPAKKSRLPHKKPRTITEQATAQFVTEDVSVKTSILDFFDMPPENELDIKIAEPTTERPITTVTRQQSSAKPGTKKKSRMAKLKKKATKSPVLLSPESAMKAAKGQDLLFGTSSQLAREESPSFMRDLQTAVTASESRLELSPFSSTVGCATSTLFSTSCTSDAPTSRDTRNLWAVSSRDPQGLLLDAEIIDLADTPKAQGVIREIRAIPRVSHKCQPVSEPAHNDTWNNIDALAEIQPERTSDKRLSLPGKGDKTQFPAFIARSVAEAALKHRPRSRSPTKKTAEPNLVASKGSLSSDSQKPDFRSYAVPRLAKAIAAYGFKPVKGRDRMIALLEKCWEGKNRTALQSLPGNANICLPPPMRVAEDTNTHVNSAKQKGYPRKTAVLITPTSEILASSAPKKPRGRPRNSIASSDLISATVKTPQPSMLPCLVPPQVERVTSPKRKQKVRLKIAVEEISDSESSQAPSPPRRRSQSATPQTLKLSSPRYRAQIPNVTPGLTRTQLFRKITEAITTFPPNQDPQNLTWHEKILIYDPIMLEDLAVWLNTEGLGRVGVDEEVGPAIVKAWCEERSICCLWKANLKGQARSRF